MPKLTLSMIVKDEEAHLGRCLASVAKNVDDIVIVDTGSTDRTKEIAASYGARVFDCNPETHPQFFFRDDEETLGPLGCPGPYSGKMCLGNFGEARNVSLSHVTGDFVFWLDADDVLEGGDLLRKLVEQMERDKMQAAWMKYEYGTDARGRVVCKLRRERIFRRGSAAWVNPIHEVVMEIKPELSVVVEDVLVRHMRPAERGGARVAHRNFKVLVQHINKNPNDARTLFYFANEARLVVPDKAITTYERYLELSGWPEERVVARCSLAEMYIERRQFAKAYTHYAAAAAETPHMPDGWFGLASLAYHRQDWASVVRFTEEGLKRGNPETVLMVNPMTRTALPHMYYSIALGKLSRVRDALESCKRGLSEIPEDGVMVQNRDLYRRVLDLQAAQSGDMSPGASDAVLFSLGGHAVEDELAPATPELLERAALRLWKECLASGEVAKAQVLLDALPFTVGERPAVDIAREKTAALAKGLVDAGASGEIGPLDADVELVLPIGVAQEKWSEPRTLWRWTTRSVHDRVVSLGLQPHDLHPRPSASDPTTREIVARLRRSSPRSHGLDVVIWTGPAVEPWTPLSPATTGIGGSETACIEVARHLVALGHRVVVYSECGEGEGWYEGVEYRHFSRFRGCKCDVFVSSRQPAIAEANIDAKLRLLWAHDVHVGHPSPDVHRWLLRYDRTLCLTEWHRKLFLDVYQWQHPSSVLVTRNGIDPTRFAPDAPLPDKRNKLIYSSSANRGLDVLLDVFPRIRAEVPDAELHVFYGFESWQRSAFLMGQAAELAEIENYKRRLAETAGVVFRGRVDQATLAREMLESKVWAYPTAFTETYCITAVEAQAAGCVPVTSEVAALPETAKWGVRIPGSNRSSEYQEAFVRETVRVLKDDDARRAVTAVGRQWALQLSWQSLAMEWSEMFDALIGEVAVQVVPRYEQMLGKRAA